MTWTVLSLGGSLIAPGSPDTRFLSDFRNLVLDLVKQGRKFIIMCGGGHTCRAYRDAARKTGNPGQEDLDRIGIQATKLNAELLRVLFSGRSHPRIVEPDRPPKSPAKPVIIASGFRPGRSTDYGSVLLARHFKARGVYNLTNVDYVYDKDPKKSRKVKPFPRLTWDEFKRFTPRDWSPGMYTPFDPVAAKLARKSGMKVIIVNGGKIPNLRACLTGKKFRGTVIE